MAVTLKEGEKAPNFKGIDQDGNEIKLADFKGKNLILYFYPKDDTPGCVKEACNLRDNYKMWLSKGYAVVGVSPDDEASHQKFIKKYDLPFPLIADPNKEVLNAYETWGEKNFYGKYPIKICIARGSNFRQINNNIESLFRDIDVFVSAQCSDYKWYDNPKYSKQWSNYLYLLEEDKDIVLQVLLLNFKQFIREKEEVFIYSKLL